MIKRFIDVFDTVSSKSNKSNIYEEWLDYCIDINLFQLEQQNLDFKGRESEYMELFSFWINIIHDYNKPVQPDYFVKNSTYAAMGNDWFDFLGYFYQNYIQSQGGKQSRGSFYTPANVCTTMAECTMFEDKDYNNTLVKDPCCGSGRLLLAGHSIAPTAIFIACDLDLIACKQTVLNFWIHGVKGSVIHMDSLSEEFYEGWRVNNYLYHGLPIPHIELVSEREAYHFIGLKHDKKPVEINKSVIENYDKSKETVQSKLM